MTAHPQHLPAVLHTCRTCGIRYVDGPDARHIHQTLYDHRPTPTPPPRDPDNTGIKTRDCKTGHHTLCNLDGTPGGVLIAPGITAECGCYCHHPTTHHTTGTCTTCGATTSRPTVTHCRSCAQHHKAA